jgi:small conductance mechanosensitive channel
MDWNAIRDKLLGLLANGGVTLLKLIGVFILGYIVIRIIKKILRRIATKAKLDSLVQKFLLNAASFVLYFLLALTLIQTAGIAITGIVAAVAAIGLAIGLALQDVLASVVNGIVLVMVRPFKEGDSVNIGGVSGKVVSINFFNTVIDTWDNKRVIIPNKNMIGCTIENEYYHDRRRNSFKFKVAHNTNIKELEKLLIDTACANSRVFTDPMPSMVMKEISETGVEVEFRFWVVSEEYAGTGNLVMQAVYNELKKNNIELANNRIVVYNEERNRNAWIDETPLIERDRTIQPDTGRIEQLTLDSYLDSLEVRVKNKRKKSKKNNKKEN